jgi:hypothetical protein
VRDGIVLGRCIRRTTVLAVKPLNRRGFVAQHQGSMLGNLWLLHFVYLERQTTARDSKGMMLIATTHTSYHDRASFVRLTTTNPGYACRLRSTPRIHALVVALERREARNRLVFRCNQRTPVTTTAVPLIDNYQFTKVRPATVTAESLA